MGTDYFASAEIGFRISAGEFKKPFRSYIPAKYHMEPRFDPKTGAKVKPEKVWDTDPEESFSLNGKEKYEDLLEFCIALGKKLGCIIETRNNHSAVVIFVSPKKKVGKQVSCGRVNLGTRKGMDIPLSQVGAVVRKLREAKKNLKTLGVKLGDPHILLDWEIS